MSDRESKVLSLIVCQDSKFKTTVNSMLTSAGFVAEKISATTFDNAKETLETNAKIEIVVVDATMFANTEMLKEIKAISDYLSAKNKWALIWIDEESYQNISANGSQPPKIIFAKLPVIKADFIELFEKVEPQNDTKQKQQSPKIPVKPQQKSPSQVNVNIVEAIQHVRETIELVNKVAKNPKDIEAVKTIGQRFNAFWGTYGYLEQKSGYKELRLLGQIIDAIGRTYAKKPTDELVKEHLNLLLRAAKSAFGILKEMRENAAPSSNSSQEVNAIYKIFISDQTLVKLAAVSQNEIDNIINQAFAGDKKAS